MFVDNLFNDFYVLISQVNNNLQILYDFARNQSYVVVYLPNYTIFFHII